MAEYNHKTIESKWQKIWEEQKPFKAAYPSDKKKFYPLIEFPYPSGEGLHTGHPRSYCALDAIARKKRMEGFNVLYPIGWDAFGLPTENYAIKMGRPPQEISKENINNFRRQLKSLGIGFDWDREVNTTDSKYYRWTQWIFLQLLKHDLAYKANIAISWCPKCKIGLANEEVVQGNCERCGTQTEKRQKEQWMLEITKYADRLLSDLDEVDYLEKIKIQQQNWIGRSEGASVKFKVRSKKSPPTADQLKAEEVKSQLEVFTTRPDTLFGATFMVIAPEHPLILNIEYGISNIDEVKDYIDVAMKKTDLERSDEKKEKTGIKIEGITAINPANNEEIPIFVADYVMMGYGTGAIMAVPAHDNRDFAFAKKYNISIKEVVRPDSSNMTNSSNRANRAYEGEGRSVNSGFLDCLMTNEAKQKMIEWLEERKLGSKSVSYKLRDWVFSRQHYWGEPIPVVYCRSCFEKSSKKKVESRKFKIGRDYIEINHEKYVIVPVPESDLPVELPVVENYEPTDSGESPLAAISDWVNTTCPVCESPAIRETDTMPTWAGSSWYYLRYIDPDNDKMLADPNKLKYWLPVDLYNGGMEHVTLHLLYSRFWHKFLFDIGVVPTKEPYQKRVSHGMILAPDGQKMSKSRGNVVNPDEMVEKFGADAFRLYEMFLGPFDQVVKWQTDGIRGTYRFLEKVWRMSDKITEDKEGEEDKESESQINKLIQKINSDIDNMQFNTSVSTMMEFMNFVEKNGSLSQSVWEKFLIVLSLFAPHIAEELWSQTNKETLICQQVWPSLDESKIIELQITYAIQVNGKLRASLDIKGNLFENDVVQKANELPNIIEYLKDSKIQKTIFVKDKIVNFVI